MLNRYTRYFSFIGTITDRQIRVQNDQISAFELQVHQIKLFLKRFKRHVKEMDKEFEVNLYRKSHMNQLLKNLEEALADNFLQSPPAQQLSKRDWKLLSGG